MTTGIIQSVDPTTLVIAPNIRKTVKITPEFVASIKLHGVKVPIEVHEVDGQFEVLDGQRRTLASIDAKLDQVPIIITEPATDDAERIVDQLVMNDQREQLTRGERVHAVQQLALIGIPAGEIAKRTSSPKESVEKSIAVAASEPALKAIEEYEITLDQAAALVEFQNDKKILADLLERARNGRQFDYAVKEARSKVKVAAAKKELTAKLKADGVPKVKETDFYSYNTGPGRKLEDLITAAGKPLTVTAHKKCPGHGAYISAYSYSEKVEAVYVCSDWAANGHQLKQRGYVESEEDRLKREARERSQAERDQAMRISTELRGEFITTLLQRDVAKLSGVLGVVAEALAGTLGSQATNYYGKGWRPLALQWLGVELPEDGQPTRLLASTLKSPGAKPLAIALAASLAMQERLYTQFNLPEVDVAYFETLQGWGHQLTEFEASELARARGTLAEEAKEAAAA